MTSPFDFVIASALMAVIIVLSATLMARHNYVPSPFPDRNKPSELIPYENTREDLGRVHWLSSLPEFRPATTGKTVAAVIAADSYTSDEFSELPFVKSDAVELARVLRTYTNEEPTMLTGADVTANRVRLLFRELSQTLWENDTFILYFAGHAWRSITQQERWVSYLCTFDTDPRNPTETAIDFGELRELLSELSAKRILVVLDACISARSDETENRETLNKLHKSFSEILGRTGERALLTARWSDQPARVRSKAVSHSLFTSFLIQGLKGSAADPEGVIRLRNLYYYLRGGVNTDDSGDAPDVELSGTIDFPLVKSGE